MPLEKGYFFILRYKSNVKYIFPIKTKNDLNTKKGDEFLLGFLKCDKIKLVITLVVNFGTEVCYRKVASKLKVSVDEVQKIREAMEEKC